MSEQIVYPGEGNDPTPDMGELAIVDHAIDPLNGEQRPREQEPTTRVDEDTAIAMAEAGEFDRRDAAQARKVARYRAGMPVPGWKPKEYYETPPTPQELEDLRLYGAFKDKDPKYAPDRMYAGSSTPYNMMEIAARYDAKADTEEEWAAILNKHKPSEAFQEAHSDWVLAPHSMPNAVELLRARQRNLVEGEEYVDSLDWENLSAHNHRTVIDRLSSAVDAEFRDIGNPPADEANPEYKRLSELRDLVTNKDTTLSALSAHLKGSAEVRVEKLRQDTEALGSMIEDVYTGKAAEYTGEEEPQPPETIS